MLIETVDETTSIKYEEQFVKRAVDAVVERRLSERRAEVVFKVARDTIARWVKRRLGKLPAWFSRAAKKVTNKPSKHC